MAAITYSRQMLIERIKRHMANGFPKTAFQPSDNEIRLYIDEAIAFNMVGQMYATAKMEGSLAVPEAYIVNFPLTNLTQDNPTMYWKATLPQTPLSLPTGYNITDAYFAINGQRGQSIFPLKNKRKPFRNLMPTPDGTFYWTIKDVIWLWATDGQNLYGKTIYVEMPVNRTSDLTETMPLPDDAIENIFNNVAGKIKDRFGIPQDIVLDNLPAGNKSS